MMYGSRASGCTQVLFLTGRSNLFAIECIYLIILVSNVYLLEEKNDIESNW